MKKGNEKGSGRRNYSRGRRLLAVLLCLLLAVQSPAAAWAFEGGELLEEPMEISVEESEPESADGEETQIPEDQEAEEEIEDSSSQETEIFVEDTQEETIISEEEETPVVEEEPAEETEIQVEDADISEEVVIESDENTAASNYRDTVLVLDESGSMSGTPIREMKSAALEFCESVLEGGDSRVAIISFESDANVVTDFTSDWATLETGINGLSSGGGTNTTQAMKDAYKLLKKSKAIVKNLVLMTDGEAERGESSDSGPYTQGPYYRYANSLYNAVVPMHKDCNVYTMGFFHSMSSSSRDFYGQVLDDIQNAGFYEIEDAEDLGFIFGEVADDISGEYKKKEEEFIKEHQDFIASSEYARVKSYDAGTEMLSKYGSLYEGYLTWKVVTLNISENPYDIVLGDLVLSEGMANSQLKTLEFHAAENLSQVTSSFIDLIDKNGSIDKDTRNAIQKLIQTDDMSDKTTFQILQNCLDKVSEDTLNKFFNLYADANILGKFTGQGIGTVNTVIKLIHYSAVVEAFSQTSMDFRMVLAAAAYESGETLMQAAVNDYISIMSSGDAAEKLASRVIASGVGTAVSYGKTLFEDTIVNGVKNFLLENMNLSNVGAAVAGKVNSFVLGCKIGYDLGRAFCNIFLNSDDTANTFVIAYSTAQMAKSITSAMESCESNLRRNGTIESAKLFCESFSMAVRAQMLTVDRIIEYLGAMQRALFVDNKAYIADMYNWLIYKIEWQGMKCHSGSAPQSLYLDPNKTYIYIACPTDVEITDASGNVILQIVNNQIRYQKSGLIAAVESGTKHVLLPGGDDYKVNIKATDQGTMDYAVCEFQQDNKMTEGILYREVPLQQNATFQSSVSPGHQAEVKPKLESEGQEVDAQVEALESDFIQSIKFVHASRTLKRGKSVTLKPSIAPKSLKDEKITWKSSKPSVAKVTANGTVTGVKKGKAVITASAVNGVKGTCTITVKEVPAKKVTLTRTSLTLNEGLTTTLKAKIAPASSTDTIRWKSSNKKIATVSKTGEVKGVKAGTAVITAITTSGKRAICKVTVRGVQSQTLKLRKKNLTLGQGKTYSLLASVTPKGTSGTIRWSSSNKKIATVSTTGVVTGVKDGKATITAKTTSGRKYTCKVRVKDYRIKKIKLDQTSIALEVGTSLVLQKTLTPAYAKEKITWKSSNPRVVSVSSTGRVGALRGGSATVTATSPSGKKAVCKVEAIQPVKSIVMENSLELTEGVQCRLNPAIYPANASDPTLRFTSDNHKVVIVSARGRLKAKAPGTAVITASSSNGIKATCTVTVIKEVIVPKEIQLDKTSAEMKVNETLKLNATILPDNAEDKTVTFTSTDPSVAEVKDGTVTAKKAGTATIIATTVNGKRAICVIKVAEEETSQE